MCENAPDFVVALLATDRGQIEDSAANPHGAWIPDSALSCRHGLKCFGNQKPVF